MKKNNTETNSDAVKRRDNRLVRHPFFWIAVVATLLAFGFRDWSFWSLLAGSFVTAAIQEST